MGPLIEVYHDFTHSFESEKRGQDFKATEYADDAGVSMRQARRDLSEMEDLGLIERYGKGRATAYRRVESGHE